MFSVFLFASVLLKASLLQPYTDDDDDDATDDDDDTTDDDDGADAAAATDDADDDYIYSNTVSRITSKS